MALFKELTIEDKQIFDKLVCKKDRLNSINDFNFFFLWNTNNSVYISVEDNLLIIKWLYKGTAYFYSPSLCNLSDFEKCLQIAMQDQNDNKFYFAGIPSYINDEITTLPQNCTIELNINSSDYIYNTSDLCELKGKKFHAKRNFVNRFKKAYNYSFKKYEESYFDDIMQIFDEWHKNSGHSVDMEEKNAIERALKNFRKLDLMIGMLFIDDKIQSFSISTKSQFGVGQVFFEKANVEYSGIYAMINYLTANTFLSDTEFINREEDMGLESLRKAKQSYNPTMIYEKYVLTCNKENNND